MKKILTITFLIIIILSNIFNINFAAVTVTEDSLLTSFNKFNPNDENT